MKKFILFQYILIMIGGTFFQISCSSPQTKDLWEEDFKYQIIFQRPILEVAYTGSSRSSFEIVAEKYNLLGQLKKPHLLINKKIIIHGCGLKWKI